MSFWLRFRALLFKEPFEPFFGKVNVLFFGLRRALFEAVQDVHHVRNLLQVKHAVPCPLVLVAQFVNPGPTVFMGLLSEGIWPS
jgi:hypothetical protein